MTTTRHYGMDWLRIGAFGLLIFYHIGMYFVPWGWHVKIAAPIDWVQIPMMATNSWRLPLLFLVSGYASAALFAKTEGAGAFMRSRSARLLIPLAFGIIVVIPVQPWIELVTQHGYAHGFAHFWLYDYFRFGTLGGIVLPTWQHLWFVVYLFVYTALAALLLVVFPVAARARIADAAARWLGGWGMLMVPFAVWLAILFAFPGHRDTHALFDDGPAHLHFLVPFFIGWLLRVRPALFDAVARCWPVAAVLALAAYVWIVWAMCGRRRARGRRPRELSPPSWLCGWCRAGRRSSRSSGSPTGTGIATIRSARCSPRRSFPFTSSTRRSSSSWAGGCCARILRRCRPS